MSAKPAATAKPAGGLAGGDFSVKRTIVKPDAPRVTETCSMLFGVCAKARLVAAASATNPATRMTHARKVARPPEPGR